MLSTTAIAQLDAYQDRVHALVNTARELIRQPPALAQPGIAKVRWHLLRVLREYQLFKHGEIFDPLIAANRTDLAVMARRLKTACIAAGEAYQSHTMRWTEQGALDNWEEYRRAVLAIVEQVDKHLAAERAAVVTLLSSVSRTRKQ